MVDYQLLYKIRRTGENNMAILQGIMDTAETCWNNSKWFSEDKSHFIVRHRDDRDAWRRESGEVFSFPENVIPIGLKYNIHRRGMPRIFSFLYKSQIM